MSKTGKMSKLAGKTWDIIFDGGASMAGQLQGSGEIDLIDTAVDIAAGQIAGNLVERKLVPSIKQSREGKALNIHVERWEGYLKNHDGPKKIRKGIRNLKKIRGKMSDYVAGEVIGTSVSTSNAISGLVHPLISTYGDDE